MTSIKRWLREPLVHFFALGAALFALFGWLNKDGFQGPNEIVVDTDRVQALRTQFERTWQRPPSNDELSGLVDAWVREEVFFREGLALGLDQGDPLVRQRVALKARFMADSLVSEEFTDEELLAYYEDNADRYRLDPRFSFRQVFFDPTRYGNNLATVLDEARDALNEGRASVPGDATLLPPMLQDVSSTDIRNLFGGTLADQLETLPASEWSGPVESAYGVHLVYIDEFAPARHLDITDVRDAVERDLLARRTEQAEDMLYEMLLERYTISMVTGEAMSPGGAAGSGRSSP